MLENFQFESERLTTGKLTNLDVKTLFGMYSDKDAMKYRGDAPMEKVADASKMVENQSLIDEEKSKTRLAIRTKSNNELIGTLLLTTEKRNKQRVFVGFSFGKEYWGNGYAQETLSMVERNILENVDVHELSAWCMKENKASIRIFKKFGFIETNQDTYSECILFVKKLEKKKQRLIILSDLWGREKSEWLIHYTDYLTPYFDIQYYDSCELGQVDKSTYKQDHLHQQFINGGIDRAVERLLELETNPIDILAFSIGGTIAWKYGLKRGFPNSIICISSTRLRKEVEKPKGKIELYFGEKDSFRPSLDWFEKMEISNNIVSNQNHQLYMNADFAKELSAKLLETYL